MVAQRNATCPYLSSAKVANALRRKGYEVALVDLFLGLPDADEQSMANLFMSEEQDIDLNISDEIMTDDVINAYVQTGRHSCLARMC